MWARLSNSVHQTWGTVLQQCLPGDKAIPAIDRTTKVPPILVGTGVRLDVLDTRPGRQITIFVHGCGTTDRGARSIERKVKRANLAGTSYLLSWNGPDLTGEAVAAASHSMMRCLDLAMAAPAPSTLLVAGGIGLGTMYNSLMKGGRVAFENGLHEAHRIAGMFGEILDALPDFESGVRLNLVGHSMGAAIVTAALKDPDVRAKVRDAVLLGTVTKGASLARRKTVNVYSRDDEALAKLGPTLGNGLASNPDLSHVELHCGHTAYWDHLSTVLPKSWRLPTDIRDAIQAPIYTPSTSSSAGGGIRPFESRLQALVQK